MKRAALCVSTTTNVLLAACLLLTNGCALFDSNVPLDGGAGDASMDASHERVEDMSADKAGRDLADPSRDLDRGENDLYKPSSMEEPTLRPAPMVGFGANVTGGRGGQVYVVTSTSMDASEQGTLAWALAQGEPDEPRAVLLAMEGAIVLDEILRIRNSNLTLDGSFAPGAGAWFEGERVEIQGDNILLQDVSFLGNDPTPDANSDALKIGYFKEGPDVQGVYMRRCAVMNGRDETLAITTRGNDSATGPRVLDVTFEGVIMANAVGDAQGEHKFGFFIGDGAEGVTMVDSLLASVSARTPFVRRHTERIEFINNVVYNGKENQTSSMSPELHVLGNVYRRGPVAEGALIRPIRLNEEDTVLFLEDNLISNAEPGDELLHHDRGTISPAPLFTPSNVQPRLASEVLERVLAVSGPRRRGVDPAERYVTPIIENTRTAQGPAQLYDYPAKMPTTTGAVPLSPDEYLPAAYRVLYPGDNSLEATIASGPWAGYQVWERVAAWQTTYVP